MSDINCLAFGEGNLTNCLFRTLSVLWVSCLRFLHFVLSNELPNLVLLWVSILKYQNSSLRVEVDRLEARTDQYETRFRNTVDA